jgi:T-complex protein 1 subunit alpha
LRLKRLVVILKINCHSLVLTRSYIVENLGEDALLNCAKTSMSSKLIGADTKFFAKLVVDAINCIKVETPLGVRYPIKSINILKAHGQSSTESQLIQGYALQNMKAHQQMPSRVHF